MAAEGRQWHCEMGHLPLVISDNCRLIVAGAEPDRIFANRFGTGPAVTGRRRNFSFPRIGFRRPWSARVGIQVRVEFSAPNRFNRTENIIQERKKSFYHSIYWGIKKKGRLTKTRKNIKIQAIAYGVTV